MIFSTCLIAGLCAPGESSSPVIAQDPARPSPETQIVLRVSDQFIQGLLGTRFDRDETVDTQVGRVGVLGTAHVTGKIHIIVHESPTESDFDVLVKGEVLSQLTATRRPVSVQTHGGAPFSARYRIVNKSDLFSAQPLTVDARNHFTLDEIRPFRRGPTGAIIRPLARPFVRRGLADGDYQANEEIRARMTPVLEAELDKLVVALNKIPPLVDQAHQLIILENKLPDERIQRYRAATKDHLLLSVGKPGHRIPDLPNLDREKQAPAELWIAVSKNAQKEDRQKFMLQNWRLIVPSLRDQIQSRSPELAKEVDEPLAQLLDEVHIEEMPGWHVLTFGPKVPLPKVESPE
jgi:hypothetical protein